MVTKTLESWLTPDRMRRVVEGLVVLILILMFATGVAIWKVTSVTHENRRLAQKIDTQSIAADRTVCVRINKINGVIAGILERSKKNIPKLSYYKQHPDELQDQLDEVDRQKSQFAQEDCGKFVSGQIRDEATKR